MKGEAELVRLYRAAGRELRSLLLGINIETFNAVKASEIQAKARRITLALDLAAKRWANTYVAGSYDIAAKRARTALEILGRKRRRAGLSSSRLQPGDAALGFLVKANLSMRKMTERYTRTALLAGRTLAQAPLKVQEFYEDEAPDIFRRYAAVAYKKEQSRGELKKRILEYLEEWIADDEFIEVGGKMWAVGRYAEMVARTALRQAQTDATKALCSEYDNDLVIVLGHGEKGCSICPDYEGNTYSLSGNDPVYPVLDEEPPFHPNCVHSIHPTSREAIETQQEYIE